MKRVYIAFRIPRDLTDRIMAWETGRKNWPVRWLAPHNLHLTVIPPWEAEEAEIIAIGSELERLKGSFSSFPVRFTRIGYGPQPTAPRLIWATGETPSGAVRLKNVLDDALNRRHHDRAPFRPRLSPRPDNRRTLFLHLTLARFRAQDFSSRLRPALAETVDWPAALSRIELIESILGPAGAEYRTLIGVDLSAPPRPA